MSCKSAIYTTMTTATTVDVGGNIPIGITTRRFGQNIRIDGNAIEINGCGYYHVSTVTTALLPVAGNFTVTLVNNGVSIPGATTTVTTTTTDDYVCATIDAIVRLSCPNAEGMLSLVVSGTSASVTNQTVVVEKI